MIAGNQHDYAIRALRQDIADILRLMKLSYEAIICIDTEQRVVVFSDGARQMFGYSVSEVIGAPLERLLPAVDRPYLAEFCQSREEARQIRPAEAMYGIRKNGRAFPVEASLYRFHYGGTQTLTLVLRDVSERAALERRLTFLAEHDPLTGLPNRRLFNDRLATAIARAQRNAHSVALLYVDVDDFKRINDRFGHAAGDVFLQRIVDRLAGSLRESDTIARIGGDEFAVVLEGAPTAGDAESVAAVLQRALDSAIMLDEGQVSASVSVGIALYPQHGQSADELLQAADRAMYESKAERSVRARIDAA